MTRFVVFEGADGSGKTTLREHGLSRLRARNVDALTVPQVSWLDPCAAAVITASRFRQGAGLYRPTQPAVTDAVVRDKEALTQRLVEPQLSRRHVLGDRHVASDLVYHDVLFGIDPTR